MIPSLLRSAREKGPQKGSLATLLAAMAITLSLLIGLRLLSLEIAPNFFWYLLCGAMWGLSLVVPGMTSSSVLISGEQAGGLSGCFAAS